MILLIKHGCYNALLLATGHVDRYFLANVWQYCHNFYEGTPQLPHEKVLATSSSGPILLWCFLPYNHEAFIKYHQKYIMYF